METILWSRSTLRAGEGWAFVVGFRGGDTVAFGGVLLVAQLGSGIIVTAVKSPRNFWAGTLLYLQRREHPTVGSIYRLRVVLRSRPR